MAITNEKEELLFKIGPGTPSGEVLRRYWLPVETSANLGGGRGDIEPSAKNPLRVKILGENLVLFRDASGKPGLLAEHCSHRGTSLYYGRIEEDGLRCLYHGWKYDRDGTCLETPAEPPESNFKLTVKHPSYPCVEIGGLIFAYMGPPDKQPPFPKYPFLFRKDGVTVAGKGNRIQNSSAFLQTLDNVLDVWHREIAHGWFKGVEPVYGIHHARGDEPATPIKYERTPWGACYVTLQNTRERGVYEYHETHAVMPVQRGRSTSMNWAVPIDDYTTRWFGVTFHPYDKDGNIPDSVLRRMAQDTPTDAGGPFYDGWFEDVGHWWNLGHPARKGPIWEDEAIMSTQGPEARNRLPDWDKWRLATSDRGVVLMHELWEEQIERVQEGLDPVGIVRGPEAEKIMPMMGEVVYLGWDEGFKRFNMSVDERIEHELEGLRARGISVD
jgi:phenylpropionate dioxygenase-like ring-hydroxylating dioxygenase large terminal subunit